MSAVVATTAAAIFFFFAANNIARIIAASVDTKGSMRISTNERCKSNQEYSQAGIAKSGGVSLALVEQR